MYSMLPIHLFLFNKNDHFIQITHFVDNHYPRNTHLVAPVNTMSHGGGDVGQTESY